jgi:hypothetical protein
VTRTHAARATILALLLLTWGTGEADDAGVLAVLSYLKMVLIGLVFLELDRAPRWAGLLAAVLAVAVLAGSLLAMR